MLWKISASILNGNDYEFIQIDLDPGSRQESGVHGKTANVLYGLAAHSPLDHGRNTAPTDDGPFDCVNKPVYHCEDQVWIAGGKCGLCRELKRGMSGFLVLHPVSFYMQSASESQLGDNECPADRGPYDCVNKPTFQCQEKVVRAGTRCNLCIHLNRGISGAQALHSIISNTQGVTETLAEDAEDDEDGSELWVHYPTRRGME